MSVNVIRTGVDPKSNIFLIITRSAESFDCLSVICLTHCCLGLLLFILYVFIAVNAFGSSIFYIVCVYFTIY